MGEELATSVSTHFSDSSDPRSGENISHSLLNIITITICAVICGADNWVDIEQFGKAKQSWLDTFLDMPHGVPSQDTLGRIFRRIDPEAFQQRFQEWTQTSSELMGGEVIAIDGKQRRRSKDKALGKAGIYMVSAWASDNNLVLAQQKVDDKSNAITAIPMLLKLLDIADMVVTMDAMGCQTAIVEQIIDQGGDYLIAVKENQGTLYENIQSLFETDHLVATADYHRTVNGGHRRIEIRECWAIDDPDALAYITDYKAWKQLGSVINVVSERRLPDKTEIETRFCISSLPANAALLLDKKRAHWRIENSLHWILDIAFREDESRVRKDHAPQNLALIRHVALNLLNRETALKVGIKAKRLRAGWDHTYLLKVLSGA